MSHPWECKKLTTWTTVELPSDDSNQSTSIKISNPDAVLPQGLSCCPNFISQERASSLMAELNQRDWTWRGFVQKRRVQEYAIKNGDDLPDGLEQLVDKLEQDCTHVLVEEYPNQPATLATTHQLVTSFECLVKPEDQDDAHFVAHVALSSPAVQHLNCPKKRVAESWQLKSPQHTLDLLLQPYALYTKSNDALWDWRCRVTRSTDCDAEDRVVVLKFYNLPEDSGDENDVVNDTAAPAPQGQQQDQRPMPPLSDILTIVVTTSPIQSNPSTELLERTFETFRLGGGEQFITCPKVVVCDGVRLKENGTSRKHANAKQALRNGIATADQVENYEEFKRRLVELCQRHADDVTSPFCRTVVHQLETRHGYGFALSQALTHCVSTPYVCVIQHDRTFMRPAPIAEALHCMWRQPSKIKYIGFNMRSNLIYSDIFTSKYGKAAFDDMKELVLRPPELLVDAEEYGPNSRSVKQLHVASHKLRQNLDSVAFTYKGSAHYEVQREWKATQRELPKDKHQMALTPTIFWYDNTHIVETAHYRDFIFNPRFHLVARGGFVEDKTSPVITKCVERSGLAAGHAKFGCYLLDDYSGYFFTGHLDGGTYMTKVEKEQRKNQNNTKNGK